jgi:hypothetical protein
MRRAHRRAFAHQRYAGATQTHNYEFNDPHFHLTNNVQEGPNIRDFLNMMGSKAGRVVLFGIPLQRQWSRPRRSSTAPPHQSPGNSVRKKV